MTACIVVGIVLAVLWALSVLFVFALVTGAKQADEKLAEMTGDDRYTDGI